MILWSTLSLSKTPGLLDRVVEYAGDLERLNGTQLEDAVERAAMDLEEERELYDRWLEAGAVPVYTGTDW